MTWPDMLVVFAVLFIASGVWFVTFCWRAAMNHYPNCSCGDCVDATLAIIERDTEKVSVSK